MTEFVRVRLENGSEASVSAAFAKSQRLKTVDKPAARNGVALPAKYDPLTKPAAAESRWAKTGKDELLTEIDSRNSVRDPEGESYIKPASEKVADLRAALDADDANIAAAGGNTSEEN
jgi:hypothetical protein